ncbi:hypothetical protein KI659_05520 [Litoribacter alkaliphilus]|uniref:Secreted protein n=1 Tax=Litoribacter ruber TaxID=702568 RepID=A0AAP2G3Y1_9BACT|nr:hypothetical protein [Litoribacter alkaliphilus]MBS9523476.1 hypothetical protein [Litoribacter alkaliphilus]
MKKLILAILMMATVQVFAQDNQQEPRTPGSEIFWENLKAHCGKAYEGELASEATNDTFAGKKLVMHVRECGDNVIKVPFFVGDDRSRTWVFTKMEDGTIELKHDHRHEDGSPDRVTMYGGTSTSTGNGKMQFFPADQETTDLIPYASSNVWWVTLDEENFSYNLRRVERDSHFSVKFDLTTEVETPDAPWGHE